MFKTAQDFYGRLRTFGGIDHMSPDWLRPFPTDWQPIKVGVENPNYAYLNTVKNALVYPMSQYELRHQCMKTFSFKHYG